MTSSQKTVDFLIEQMASAGVVTAKKMFGEYGVYCDGKVVAFICDERLFLKPTEAGRKMLEGGEEAPPYLGAKLYLVIDESQWDDAEWLGNIVAATAAGLPGPKPKKAKTS